MGVKSLKIENGYYGQTSFLITIDVPSYMGKTVQESQQFHMLFGMKKWVYH